MEDYCVICGAIVPEGLQVCPICERKYGIRKNESAEMNILLESSCSSAQRFLGKKNGKHPYRVTVQMLSPSNRLE